MPGVWIVAEDGYKGSEGWGGASLWGFIPMGKRTGQDVLTSQRVRCLAELALLPALTLLDPSITWLDGGDAAFEVRSASSGVEVVVRFDVDPGGDITRATSPARPYDIPDGYAEAPWGYDFGDHREFDGVRIPSSLVAFFQKAGGREEYLRAQVTAVRPS
jgi:hypothetical protein